MSALLHACNSDGSSDKRLDVDLRTVFADVYTAKFGKYAPNDESDLDRCKTKGDQQCLDIYDRFMQSTKRLRTMDPSSSLTVTLSIVEQTCIPEQERELGYYDVCAGGLITLYRYRTPELDALMLEGIRGFPTELQEEVFDVSDHWLLNRPNPRLWIDFVEQSDMDSRTKERALKRLDVNNPDAKPENRDWTLRKGFDE